MDAHLKIGIAYHARSYGLVVGGVVSGEDSDLIIGTAQPHPQPNSNSTRVGSVYTRLIYYYVTAVQV